MREVIRNWFTARDNISYSLTKLIGVAGGVAMVFNFIVKGSDDFQGFGTGIGLIMAALAAKYFVEEK